MNGKLFFNAADDIGRQSVHEQDQHAIAVSLRGRHQMNFHPPGFHGADPVDPVAHSLAEDLTDVGGRIGTDQSVLACVSQPYRRRAGRGFPHAAFAGEEDEREISRNGIVIVQLLRDQGIGEVLQQRGCVLSSFQSCVRQMPAGEIFPDGAARHRQLAVKQGSGTDSIPDVFRKAHDRRTQELLRVLCRL